MFFSKVLKILPYYDIILMLEYYKVVVRAYDAEMNRTIYKSLEKNGVITLDGDCYEFDIAVEGRVDKATRPGVSSYSVRYYVGSGNWTATRQ